MKKWESYIKRQKEEFTRIPYPKEANAATIVVIPCLNEPGLLETLHDLFACTRPGVNVLIAIVINSGVQTDEASVLQNRATYSEVKDFSRQYNQTGFTFFPLLFEELPRKHAGVGLARKIGMDLAVNHFLENKSTGGVIVSLDADCLVSPDFLISIHHAFLEDSRLNATIHHVKHRVEKKDPILEKSIRQYEAYLRYYRYMLKKIDFPYYYQTIGSAFAVTADTYVKVGGMGRQQGGEDFYFLQKVFEFGKVKELAEAKVYPLARYSDRVPFGTGPALERMMHHPEEPLKVYSRRSFLELGRLFSRVDSFYRQPNDVMARYITDLHPELLAYLEEIGFEDILLDCNSNSARLDTFRKRFFHHFNAFRIIKYLNRVHPDPFPLEEVSSFPGG